MKNDTHLCRGGMLWQPLTNADFHACHALGETTYRDCVNIGVHLRLLEKIKTKKIFEIINTKKVL